MVLGTAMPLVRLYTEALRYEINASITQVLVMQEHRYEALHNNQKKTHTLECGFSGRETRSSRLVYEADGT